MSIKKITKLNLVLLLVTTLNGFVEADEVVVSKRNDEISTDLGTVLPGATKDLTIKLDESSSCSSIKGSVTDASEDDGWVGGGEGQSITVTFNAPKDDSGVHTGLIKGKFIGCPKSDGDGGSDWDVSADVNVECSITSVEFKSADGSAIEDMDNVSLPEDTRIPQKLGKRIFAGAKSSDGNANNEVKVVVEFKDGAELPDRIFLKSFDVDDPSFDSGPVDKESGSDNRALLLRVDGDGEFKNGENKIEKSTGESGKVSAKFNVTGSPGDNFRVCASCSEKVLGDLKAKNPDPDDKAQVFNGDKAVPDDNEGTAPVKSTDVLTVWRKLHIELDAMGKVTGNFSKGDSTKQVTQDNNNNETTVEVDNNDLDDGGDKGRFESGRLTVNSTEYPIKKNNSDDFVLDGLYNVPVGDPWTAHDDDVYTNDNLPMPDTELLNLALSDVYIEPRYDVGDNNGNVSVVLNYEDTGQIDDDWDSENKNGQRFWVTYYLSGFQDEREVDHDPDSEPAVLGVTGAYGGSMSYLETIADVAQEDGTDPETEEETNVVHEIGHALDNGDHDDPVETGGRYVDDCIHYIRNCISPES